MLRYFFLMALLNLSTVCFGAEGEPKTNQEASPTQGEQSNQKAAWTEAWETDEAWEDESDPEDPPKQPKENGQKNAQHNGDWDESWESDESWEGGAEARETKEEAPQGDLHSTAQDENLSHQKQTDNKKDGFFANLDFTGEIAPEYRYFPLGGLQGQPRTNLSLRIEPEMESKWHNDQDIFNVRFFWRQDQRDKYRTHGDIRELFWQHVIAPGWDFKLGISKVFWGVAETRHLVDVINQTDAIENLDGEAKLGQPMLRLSSTSALGIIDGYLLPYFRERTFPGPNGRIRTPIRVAQNHVLFESSEGRHHLDWAIRWSKTLGALDIGLNVFRGTVRDPFFALGLIQGELLLIPTYQIVQEYSTDIQATLGSWLWKFEGLLRRGQAKTFNAQVFGFEYTTVGVFDTKVDIGWLMEYHHDTRIQNLSPFDNDLAVGLRFALNDVNDSQLLAFVLYDRKQNSQMYRVEASRRIGDRFKLNLEGTFFAHTNPVDPLSFIRRDHLIQAELVYYL